MITRIEALNYRCLRYVAQDLGPFQVLAGPNGSGKSTFLDVPAMIRDIVRDGLEAAITSRVPDHSYLFWLRRGDRFELAIEAAIPKALHGQTDFLSELTQLTQDAGGQPVCRYELAVGVLAKTEELGILAERLMVGCPQRDPVGPRGSFPHSPSPPPTILGAPGKDWSAVVDRDDHGRSCFHAETGHLDRKAYSFSLQCPTSALANLPDDDLQFPVGVWFKNSLLGKTRTIFLNTEAMHLPSSKGRFDGMRRDGANLPWLIEQLDPASRQEWIRHLQTALPDLRDVTTFLRDEDATRYVKLHYHNGAEVRSWLVSDGALRVLALTLLDYLPTAGSVYLIEEPENGVHPGAIETVFQSLSSIRDGQVLLATHSPLVVGLAELDQLLCFAKPPEGPTDIVPGPQHPMLQDWHHDVDLGTFMAAGVLG